jgi:hypothetical protein
VRQSSLWVRFVSEFWYRLPAPDDYATGNNGGVITQSVFRFWRTYIYQGRPAARLFRVGAAMLAMLALWGLLVSVLGHAAPPTRGNVSFYAYQAITFVLVFATLALVLSVADATLLSWRIVKSFRAETTIWPRKTLEQYRERLALSEPFPQLVLDDWLDLLFISKRTRCITTQIYFPFLIIALLVLSRSPLFANYAPSKPDLITTGLGLLTLCACAVALRWSAEDSRAKARRRLNDEIVAARKLEDGGRLAGQLEMLLRRVEELRDGAFSPFSQQPLVRGLLLPLGSLGGTFLLEHLLLPGAL